MNDPDDVYLLRLDLVENPIGGFQDLRDVGRSRVQTGKVVVVFKLIRLKRMTGGGDIAPQRGLHHTF